MIMSGGAETRKGEEAVKGRGQRARGRGWRGAHAVKAREAQVLLGSGVDRLCGALSVRDEGEGDEREEDEEMS